MNKILIVDASGSDVRVMSGLLSKAGYDPLDAICNNGGHTRFVLTSRT